MTERKKPLTRRRGAKITVQVISTPVASKNQENIDRSFKRLSSITDRIISKLTPERAADHERVTLVYIIALLLTPHTAFTIKQSVAWLNDLGVLDQVEVGYLFERFDTAGV